jgi:hypothetical protein
LVQHRISLSTVYGKTPDVGDDIIYDRIEIIIYAVFVGSEYVWDVDPFLFVGELDGLGAAAGFVLLGGNFRGVLCGAHLAAGNEKENDECKCVFHIAGSLKLV